jgi:hypothetical protein
MRVRVSFVARKLAPAFARKKMCPSCVPLEGDSVCQISEGGVPMRFELRYPYMVLYD